LVLLFNLQADGAIMEDIEISNLNIIVFSKRGFFWFSLTLYSKWGFDMGSVGASIDRIPIFIEPWTA